MTKTKTKTKKVYDFSMPRVKNQLVRVLKRKKNESTIADLISASGLPKYQVEETIKVVSNEYRGHLKVTESGELVYYFPNGMRNQEKGFIPGLKTFFKGFGAVLKRILTFLFKIWIMVMLVGYFILFLVILIAAVLATLAISFSGKGKSRGSKGGLFYLVIKLFELFARIWFYGQILKGPRTKKKGRPLHQAVFAFIFGEPDPNAEWEQEERKYVISYIQSHKGVVTLEELMALTGKNTAEANLLINRYLLEFEGEPRVTDQGSIYYFFPELLRTSTSLTTRVSVSLRNPKKKVLVPFNFNAKKKNGWIAFFNGFNLAFGSYFLYYATSAPNLMMEVIRNKIVIDFALVYRFLNTFLTDVVANPPALIALVLGIIPLVFSFFFYFVPFMRNLGRKKGNQEIKKENLRKKIYTYIHENPMGVDPKGIQAQEENETPKNGEKFKEKVIKQFVGEKFGDVEAVADNVYIYKLPELQRQKEDIQAFRNSINLSDYAVGETVFDSGE